MFFLLIIINLPITGSCFFYKKWANVLNKFDLRPSKSPLPPPIESPTAAIRFNSVIYKP